jgi:hypothetical protein
MKMGQDCRQYRVPVLSDNATVYESSFACVYWTVNKMLTNCSMHVLGPLAAPRMERRSDVN